MNPNSYYNLNNPEFFLEFDEIVVFGMIWTIVVWCAPNINSHSSFKNLLKISRLNSLIWLHLRHS
jgi:hypothetical protein